MRHSRRVIDSQLVPDEQSVAPPLVGHEVAIVLRFQALVLWRT